MAVIAGATTTHVNLFLRASVTFRLYRLACRGVIGLVHSRIPVFVVADDPRKVNST